MAEAALLTERSALQHCPGSLGGDVLRAPDLGERFEGSIHPTPAPAEQALLHIPGGHQHPSPGCELPEIAPVLVSCAARGNQELHAAGSPASSAGHSLLGFFQLLASSDSEDEDFSRQYKVWRFLTHPSLPMLCLVLTGLATLSQRGEMVSRAQSRGAMLAARGWGGG